jgi:hypothetical protein
MLRLPDMLEGWAQSGRLDQADMARLFGWADGLRSLAAEIGNDYVPPQPAPNSRPSLMKFLANKMLE